MQPILWWTKIKIKHLNKRAFSSIVGAIFMVLIVCSLASAYFFFTLNQNTSYNEAVRQRNEIDLARMAENIQALDSAYKVNSNGVVTVTTLIQNSGSSDALLTTIWVTARDISSAWNSYNYSTISFTLQSAETMTESFDIAISGLTTTGSYRFASWIITSRGNSVAMKSGQSNSFTFATVSAGIGSIAMNSQGFRNFVINSAGNILENTSSYTVTRDEAHAFSVQLINFDSSGKDLILDRNSAFWASLPPSSNGAMKAFSWKISKNVGNQIIPLAAGETITLEYGQTKQVFFSNLNSISNVLDDGAAMVNLVLIGKIQTTPQNDYGQNLPFISIIIAPT